MVVWSVRQQPLIASHSSLLAASLPDFCQVSESFRSNKNGVNGQMVGFLLGFLFGLGLGGYRI